jgi:hypothetical protein
MTHSDVIDFMACPRTSGLVAALRRAVATSSRSLCPSTAPPPTDAGASAWRDELLSAALAHVPHLGWSSDAIAAAAAERGLSAAAAAIVDAHLAGAALAEHHVRTANARLRDELAATPPTQCVSRLPCRLAGWAARPDSGALTRIACARIRVWRVARKRMPERIRAVVVARLGMNAPLLARLPEVRAQCGSLTGVLIVRSPAIHRGWRRLLPILRRPPDVFNIWRS